MAALPMTPFAPVSRIRTQQVYDAVLIFGANRRGRIVRCAPVAQGIEQRFPKPQVGGSNPLGGTFFRRQVESTAFGGSGAALRSHRGKGHISATPTRTLSGYVYAFPRARPPFVRSSGHGRCSRPGRGQTYLYHARYNCLDIGLRPKTRTTCTHYSSGVLILGLILFGMLTGAAAQLILGKSSAGIDWLLAMTAGLVGSFVGGLTVSLLSGDGFDLRPSGIIGSILGAVIVTAGWRWWTSRSSN